MHPRRFSAVFPLGLLCAPFARAGGTVGFEEVESILKQKPEVFATLKAEYSLPDSAFAEVRLGPHFKHLSGARTGPYTFLAQKRGQKGTAKTQVLVCTDVQFISSAGRPLAWPTREQATGIRETLASISFHECDVRPVCAK